MNQPSSTMDGTGGHSTFVATHWSMILVAGNGSPEASAALEELCRVYWYPLYAYVRRRGHDLQEAQDSVQEFFYRLLKTNSLRDVHPSKGKFRSFLLAAMNNFLAKEWRREQAEKRGGGKSVFSLDAAAAEDRYKLEPADDQTPEKIFERRWAMTLLDQTFARLRQEWSESGKAGLFSALKGMLTGEKCEQRYAEIADQLGMTEDAVKQAARRLRESYGKLLRQQIAQTVSAPDEVDEEMRYLFRAVQA